METMAEAYDMRCAAADERLRRLMRTKPPCGVCGNYCASDVGGVGYCLAGWSERLARYRRDGAGVPLPEVVEAAGEPPCGWEAFE